MNRFDENFFWGRAAGAPSLPYESSLRIGEGTEGHISCKNRSFVLTTIVVGVLFSFPAPALWQARHPSISNF